MRKLKLLLAAAALFGVTAAWAQTDVTATYVVNPGFESCTPRTDNIAASGTAAGDDYASEDWTLATSSSWSCSAVVAYGGTGQVNGVNAPSTDNAGNTGNALGFSVGWGGTNKYQSSAAVTLPVGHYVLTVNAYNNLEGVTQFKSLNGFVPTSGDPYLSTKGSFKYATWETDVIEFDLTVATEGKFQIGGQAISGGSGSNAKVFFDNITLTYTDPLKAAKDALQAEIDKANAIKSYGYDNGLSDLNAAISTAEGVLSTATTEDELTTGKNDLKSAESTFATANSFANGKFLIKNIGANMFWGAGNNWGTQASLVAYPEYLKLVPQTEPFTYYIESQVSNGGTNYYFNGSFMDNDSPVALTIKRVSDGVYTIANGAMVYGYDGSTTVLGSDIDGATTNGQWNIVSIADATTALSSATSASPTDATFLINDHNFGRNNRDFSSWSVTSGGGDAKKAGDNENMNWQQWNASCDINQTVSGLPNGKYTLKAKGFYRPGANNTASTDQNAKLYAGDDNEIGIALVSSTHADAADAATGLTTENTNEGVSYYVPNSQGDASKAFSAGLYENTLENIIVSDGSLKIGAKNEATTGNQWLVIDNFRLYYYGPTISTAAVELPAGDMTADTWYYFDIAIDGDYDLTLTTLSDIVYTTDATILVEGQGTVTANFAKTAELALTAGRYYVKSSSAQTLKVAAHSFTYEVGAATLSVADGKYTQTNTFTVTFPSASTNDPSGETTLAASSKATVNGAEVALSAETNGFSLDLGALTPGTDYAIVIPAGVYGYAGESMNAAISLTIHTPAVFDGEYCLYDATNKLFLGRGCAYGTEAAADKYGIPFNLVTNADGTSSIEFVDWTGVYLFSTSVGNAASMYTDNASSGWSFVPTTGGYYLKDVNGDVYAKIDNGGYGYYVHTVAGSAEATVWTLKTKAERDAIIAAYPAENIENVITASGISTTAGEFATYLSENYNAVDATANIGTATFAGSAGDWTWNQVRGQDGQPAYGTNFAEVWCATGSYTQTIDKDKLPAGIYKVTVQGYERRKANAAATDLFTDGYNNVSTYLAANGEQVRFTDWNEVAEKPTNTGGAVTAFGAGEATNVIYVYLDGATDLTLTVKKPNYIWDCWAIFNNFTLTRYEELSSATMAITDAKWATFCAPFDVEIPAGVTAYTVDDVESDGTTLTITEVTGGTISANTPVVLNSASTMSEVKKGVEVSGTPQVGLLTGTYTAIAAPNGSYILQNQGGTVAFYQVNTGIATPNVPANHAYLTDGGGARALFFGETTGISAIQALTAGEAEIYGANGVRQNSLQKGVNIIKTKDGKSMKVMVK